MTRRTTWRRISRWAWSSTIDGVLCHVWEHHEYDPESGRTEVSWRASALLRGTHYRVYADGATCDYPDRHAAQQTVALVARQWSTERKRRAA